MAVVCSIDLLNEIFDLVPNWRKRYLLNIDTSIKMFKFVNDDLWHPDLHNRVFNDFIKTTSPVSIVDLNREYELVKSYYG